MSESRWFAIRRLVAEFAVIVMGVLVALGVDSWRESRAEERLATEHLRILLSDLTADSVAMDDMAYLVERKQEALSVLRSVARGEVTVPPDSIAGLLYPSAVLGWRIPAARNAAYEELMSTGGLRLIDDPVLRGEIVAYYESYEHQLERLDRHRSGFPSATYQLLPYEAYSRTEAPGPEGRDLISRLRTDEMRALLNHESNYTALLASQVSGFVARVAHLLSEIRAAVH